ncbi:RELT-like protein 1 isoform X1 [Ranitomeya variabilis]|uniref:RELT-like protein 1 isoform X1 n=1 Tax=Ranitomeya variabilis TaxID=490064 RepID=UPI004055FA2F
MSPVVKLQGPWRVVRSAALESQPSTDPSAARPSTSNTADTPSGGHPEYVAFYLVPIFFIMGLLGVLICHILKKKGYRCTTEAEPEVEKITGEKIEMQDGVGETNNDTVGQIVSFIMKNEANADVLKAMVADTSGVGDNSLFDPESPTTPNTPVTPTSPVSPSSPGGTPSKHSCRGNHLHTIGGVADKNVCSRCSNKRWNMIRSPLKQKEARKSRPGAVTVLSVGRFRVTKVEPKSKERKRLMSDGTEAANGDVPPTPVSVDTRQRSGTETENQSSVDT